MNNSKYRLIALIGKSGSGKDTILKEVLKNENFHSVVGVTTRPPRENEQEGIDYYFIDTDTFTKLLFDNKLIEATSFNGWGYGTPYSSLSANKINIAVLNPAGIEILRDNSHIDLTVIYINVSDKIRLIRQLSREENPNIQEIIRRYSVDEEDFNPNVINELIDYTAVNEDIIDLNSIVTAIIEGQF